MTSDFRIERDLRAERREGSDESLASVRPPTARKGAGLKAQHEFEDASRGPATSSEQRLSLRHAKGLMAVPLPPNTLEETGLDRDLVIQLIVKTLYYAGEATGVEVTDRLRLPYSIVDDLFQFLRSEKLCEVKGVAGIDRRFYRYGLTSLGRERAREFLEINYYVGAAPVPLAQYTEMVLAQSVYNFEVDRESLVRGLSHLVVSDLVIDQLGPAMNSGHSIFIYGAPGNGKSIISEALGLVLARGGDIFIPHAIEVDNQIVKVFNPVDHIASEGESPADDSSMRSIEHDRRWVRCKRPTVFVGGELTLEMLDLRLDPIAKYYEAPPQVKANGGVFIVDDLGRQLVRPRDLLNRWIVPLEKRVDYFTLHTGEKFPIPFDTLVIFATNIDPEELVDEAFFRRIRFKVRIDNPTKPMYAEIFKRYCESKGIEYNPAIVEFLFAEYYDKYDLQPRSCHPRDLIDQVIAIAKFTGRPITLTEEMIEKACRSYFVVDESATPVRLDKKGSSWADLVNLFGEMVKRKEGATG